MSRRLSALLVAACALATACAPRTPAPESTTGSLPPDGTPSAPSTVSATPSASASPTTTASPGPEETGDYPAALVQKCLENGSTKTQDKSKSKSKGKTKTTTPPKDCPKKTVFLTFDDGPSDLTTKHYLKIMSDKKVHGTFFVIGRVARDNPALLRDIVAGGNAVAVHSYTHDYRLLYPYGRANASNVASDAAKALAAIQKALGPDYHTGAYRYPGGHMSWRGMPPADQALQKEGLYWIDWNAMTGDADVARPATAKGMVTLVMSQAKAAKNPTIVVLMHDGLPGQGLTEHALPRIIDDFKKQGYQFGTIR